LEWADPLLESGPILIHSGATTSVTPTETSSQEWYQETRAVEQMLGEIARRLVNRGVRRLVIAGGETSGAVVQALGVRTLRVGATIDPGIPWMETTEGTPLALALKSGNFGTDDFFLKALQLLDGSRALEMSR